MTTRSQSKELSYSSNMSDYSDDSDLVERTSFPLYRINRSESYWALPHNCFATLRSKGILIGQMIGHGYWSSVYSACSFGEHEPCPKIVKIVPIYPIVPRRDVSLAEKYLAGEIGKDVYDEGLWFSDQLKIYDRRRDLKIPQSKEEIAFEREYRPEIEKHSPLTSHRRTADFNEEVNLTRLASDLNVSPIIHDWFICDGVLRIPEYGQLLSLGFIIMDRWDISVDDYFRKYGRKLPYQIQTLLQKKIRLLHQSGIAHDDLHFGNVLLKIDPQTEIPLDVALIDFGNAITANQNKTAFDHAVRNDLRDITDMIRYTPD